MRATWLWALLVPGYFIGACAAGQGGGSWDDDDDDDGGGGSSTTTGSGGSSSTTTSTQTTSTTDTTTSSTTSSTTTSSTSTPSCYAGHGDCDPMQSGSCPTAGAACDIESQSLEFFCFDPPNTAGLGAPCNASTGPYCMHGLTCVTSGSSDICAAYCCTTADCASCTSVGTVGSIEVLVCAQ